MEQSSDDRPVMLWAERWVHWLDDAIRIPGTSIRFGLDPILGALLPGLGDAVTALSSIALLLLAIKRGVPTATLLRMLVNIGVDVLIGAIPVIGDVFDVQWKANRRNLDLIEHAHTSAKAPATRDYAIVVAAALALVGASVLSALITAALLSAVHGWIRSSGAG